MPKISTKKGLDSMRVLLVVYDNGSHIHQFPQGLAHIAKILMLEGYEVEIYSQDVHHYADEHLKQKLDEEKYDVVGLSLIAGYYQYRKLLKLSDVINKSKNRPLYIIGGHGPSPDPEYFLKKTGADMIVMGEGEETAKELFHAIDNKEPLSGILGIAYKDGDEVIINKERPLIQDIDSLPLPAYELFDISHYRILPAIMPGSEPTDFVMPVLSGRGCTFKCNFCYRMDKGFRPHSAERIIENISLLQNDYGINYISFADELLMSSVRRTEELCHAFMKSGLRFKWACNGRLNYAKLDLLKLMKKAGCLFINYGIEAMDNQILKNMDKALTTDQVTKGVEATLQAGISPGLNILFGNIGENRETLRKGVDFLLKYDDGVQMRTIRPVTPYPGSPLYYHAIEKGFLKDCEDFYENKHTNSDLMAVNFTELSDEEFYQALYEANMMLLDNYIARRQKRNSATLKKLYIERDSSFRGFR